MKVGIVGLGVGEAHIKGYSSHPQAEVIALCDFNSEVLAKAKKNYPNMISTEKADDIFENADVDAVSIASYDNDHFQQIIKAIENDKHIFVEKPLCLYEKEARIIRAKLAEKPYLKLSSNLILRKCQRFIALKDKIVNNEMGSVFHIEGDYNYGRLHKITEGWRGQIDFYSVVYGGGVHIIDLMLWMTGKKVVEVHGFGNNLASQGSQYKYNDSITCILRFDDGMTGKVSVHYGCVRPHFHNFNVFGTKATFINQKEQGLYYNSMDPDAQVEKMTQPYPGVHKGDLIHSFVEAIVNDKQADVSTEDVFSAMSVCFAIEESIKSAKPQHVNYI